MRKLRIIPPPLRIILSITSPSFMSHIDIQRFATATQAQDLETVAEANDHATLTVFAGTK